MGCSSPVTNREFSLHPGFPDGTDGGRVYRYASEDGAVIRNIDACGTIASTVLTSLGPFGRNKIVINHLQKMILTSDAATILRELEVVHPAAKLVVMASQQQEAEVRIHYRMEVVLWLIGWVDGRRHELGNCAGWRDVEDG